MCACASVEVGERTSVLLYLPPPSKDDKKGKGLDGNDDDDVFAFTETKEVLIDYEGRVNLSCWFFSVRTSTTSINTGIIR